MIDLDFIFNQVCLSYPSKKRPLTSEEESCDMERFSNLKKKLAISVDSAKECLTVVAPLVVLLSQHKDNLALKMKEEYLDVLGFLSSHECMKDVFTADYSYQNIKSEENVDTFLELASASTRLLAALYLNHNGETVRFFFNFLNVLAKIIFT